MINHPHTSTPGLRDKVTHRPGRNQYVNSQGREARIYR
jgi:hypothetical protein